MTQRAKEYLNDPDFFTLKQAAEETGLNQVTFRKYAANIGISGRPISKYTFFTNDEVEKVRELIKKQAHVWLRMLENATGVRWAPTQEKN
ncbi:MAG: hypothetical protein IJM04_07235 [Prevotella sp.]|nr:hypothetical protein [Prevotella sp.]